MTNPADTLLFVGTNGNVRAVDKHTGKDAWDVSLPDTGFEIVSLLYDSGVLFAGSNGYLFALDPADGKILWKNELKGLGHEHMVLASVAGTTDPVLLKAALDKADKEEVVQEDLEASQDENRKRGRRD